MATANKCEHPACNCVVCKKQDDRSLLLLEGLPAARKYAAILGTRKTLGSRNVARASDFAGH